MRRTLIPFVVLSLAACQAGAPPAEATADPWQPVRFLAGHWRAETADSVSLEAWTAPAGDAMFGQNRALRGGRLEFFELLSIERHGERLVYVARPGGGPPTAFPMTASAHHTVTFENREHDFPKRIRYALSEDGALRAIVDDGTDGGQRLTFSWQPAR